MDDDTMTGIDRSVVKDLINGYLFAGDDTLENCRERRIESAYRLDRTALFPTSKCSPS